MTSSVLAQLEQQHTALGAQFESFAYQLFDSERSGTIAEGLLDLLLVIGMHFGFEESVMTEMRYAELEHHRRQHLSFMTELGLLLDHLESTTDIHAVARSVDLLSNWYHRHATQSDAPLSRWLAALPA